MRSGSPGTRLREDNGINSRLNYPCFCCCVRRAKKVEVWIKKGRTLRFPNAGRSSIGVAGNLSNCSRVALGNGSIPVFISGDINFHAAPFDAIKSAFIFIFFIFYFLISTPYQLKIECS